MSSLQNKEILVIDDSPEILLLARKILEGDGAMVHTAESVTAGLAVCKEKAPHLVITDLNMQELTGFDFLERKRAITELKRVPIIVLSGLNDKISVQRAVSLGAADYVLKPFKATLLLQKVKKALNSAAFFSHKFQPGERPKIDLATAGEIIMVSEIGFLIESPVKLGGESDVKVESLLLDQLEATHVVMRTTQTGGRFAGSGRYIAEINFVGIGEKVARKIRKTLRGTP